MKVAGKLLVLVGLALLVGVLPGAAQGKKSVILNAPFSFVVEQQTLPAGSYRIVVEHGWLQIRSVDRKTAAIVLTLPVSGKTPEGMGQVVFNRYGNRYFLSQVWVPDMPVGRQTLESREERDLVKQEKQEVVAIKLNGQSAR